MLRCQKIWGERGVSIPRPVVHNHVCFHYTTDTIWWGTRESNSTAPKRTALQAAQGTIPVVYPDSGRTSAPFHHRQLFSYQRLQNFWWKRWELNPLKSACKAVSRPDGTPKFSGGRRRSRSPDAFASPPPSKRVRHLAGSSSSGGERSSRNPDPKVRTAFQAGPAPWPVLSPWRRAEESNPHLLRCLRCSKPAAVHPRHPPISHPLTFFPRGP